MSDQVTPADERPSGPANDQADTPQPSRRSNAPRRGSAGRAVAFVLAAVVLVLLIGAILYFTRAIRTRPLVVPSVLRLTQPAASTQLSAAGFALGTASDVATSQVGAGLVVTQHPVANATAPKGSSVDVSIAVAPVNTSTPKLIGMPLADAVAQLESRLFLVGHYREYSDKVPAGIVAEQLPEPGVPIQTGSRIILSVSLGPGKGSSVPNIVGMHQAEATAALAKAGVTPLWTYSTFNPTNVAFGTVIDQAPNAGTVVPEGEVVAATLTIAQQ